ncbi:CG31211 [Drosophila busckii]|uniref:CG31211 n=1 Tax=Drosophila busckii TaxID=30019 RepID=A0A0M4EHM2_DROBS|nr:CG31211 [Drosophila busckii]
MFPGDKKNINPNLSYNKHNQYMNVGNSPVFLPTSGPGPDICNYLNSGLRMPLNMQGDIDWAKLAQQWIHMRDLNPSGVLPIANCNINMPMAPPPPIIGNVPEYRHQSHLLELHQHQLSKAQPRYEEQGEAEMDMDEDENGGRVGVISESQTPDSLISKQPWTNSNNNKRLSIAVLSKNITDAIDPQQWNNWQKVQNSPTAHIPSLLKLNISNPNEQHQLTVQQAQDSLQTKYAEVNVTSGNELDANKRKMLPAWIREGLEKMEREKQRRLEREVHPILDIESSATDFKQVSSQTIRKPDNILNILNVASDSEEDFNSPVETAHVETSMAQLIGNNKLSRSSSSDEENENRCQRSQQQQSVNNTSVARTRNVEAATITGKSYEAKLANLMLIVRRTLTEILLETTNEEIAAIANETIEAHRAEGLAAYGDSSSESEDEDKGKYTHDSATKETNRSVELVTDELKLRIRKSKRAFEKVIDEIEERVSHQAQIDEQNLQQDRKLEMEQDYAKKPRLIIEQRFQPQSNAESFSTSNATSVHNDKLPHFNGKN